MPAPPSYQCVFCGRRTYHPDDIAHGYCPCCGDVDCLPKACRHRARRENDLDPPPPGLPG